MSAAVFFFPAERRGQRRLQTLVKGTAKSKDAALAAYELLQNEMKAVAEEDPELHTCILQRVPTTRSEIAPANTVDPQRNPEGHQKLMSSWTLCKEDAQKLYAQLVELEATPLDVLRANSATNEPAASETPDNAEPMAEDTEAYLSRDEDAADDVDGKN